MPSQKQLQWAQLRVGLTVIFASIALAVLIFLMTGTTGLFTKKLTLFAYVSDAGGLRTGAPVRLQSVDIGNVTALRIDPSRPKSPVKIIMRVAGKSADFLKKDSVVMLSTAGVLGETFVNIDSTSANGPRVQNDDTLQSRDVADIQDVVRSSQSTLDNVNVLVTRVDHIVSAVETGQGSVGALIYDKSLYNNLNASVAQAQSILNEINSDKSSLGMLLKSDELYNKLNSSVDKFNRMADQLQAGEGTIGKLLKDPSLYNNANQTVTKLNDLMRDVNAGKGALGKFASDQEFANKLQNVVNRLSDITDRLDRGEGSAGKLLRDSTLYDNTNKLLADSQQLVRAIREDPKRYLTIKLKIF